MKPIAIHLSCRDRYAVTQKCIESLLKKTRRPVHLFVYDNVTTYRTKEQWEYFRSLYEDGKICKYVANTVTSTYGCFGKIVSFNDFGFYIAAHPNPNAYEMIVCLDNDMIAVEDGWDDLVVAARTELNKGPNHIEIIGQYPGGTSGYETEIVLNGKKYRSRIGIQGGSGFWCMQPDFFDKVGFLDPKDFVGVGKGHDTSLWKKLSDFTGGKPYTYVIDHPMFLHFSYVNGKDLSICRTNRHDPSMIVVHEDVDKFVEAMPYEDFIAFIKKDVDILSKW
jgi:hypothetical protein